MRKLIGTTSGHSLTWIIIYQGCCLSQINFFPMVNRELFSVFKLNKQFSIKQFCSLAENSALHRTINIKIVSHSQLFLVRSMIGHHRKKNFVLLFCRASICHRIFSMSIFILLPDFKNFIHKFWYHLVGVRWWLGFVGVRASVSYSVLWFDWSSELSQSAPRLQPPHSTVTTPTQTETYPKALLDSIL